MKSLREKNAEKRGFTIVELLTVMSVIVILIGLLVPSLNKVKRYARDVKQKAQFHSIDVAMELFASEHDGYPESKRYDEDGQVYPGALRLCEAMMGQDQMGYDPDSHFRQDGMVYDSVNGKWVSLYRNSKTNLLDADLPASLKKRRGPYLQLENANANTLYNIYARSYAPLAPIAQKYVLCDVYKRVVNQDTGKRIGMPILYYRANTSNQFFSKVDADAGNSIYDYHDNELIVDASIPLSIPPIAHPMASTGLTSIGVAADIQTNFYDKIENTDISSMSSTSTYRRPYCADSYILIAAGFDGEYGTSDDIFNFGQK